MDCGYKKVVSYMVEVCSSSLQSLYFSEVIDDSFFTILRILYYIFNHTLTILALHYICFRLISFVIVAICDVDSIYVAVYPVPHNMYLFGWSCWWLLFNFIL